MTYPNLDAVKSHLVEVQGYQLEEVIRWLKSFTDDRHIAALLADPIVVIRDFPITHAEHLARQERLTVREDIWDGLED